ncbi:hypothetical protein OH76DRAFT_429172 [Lentinus brumalis]|uniref:Uncharacterized protein n=1 Tax=Lentinus brumalis TaxID=2498619 RepID=A0A371DDK2_9APHY|nr:hypothetical protein OH76DRAFT_429172 [Polyporus brumalis]
MPPQDPRERSGRRGTRRSPGTSTVTSSRSARRPGGILIALVDCRRTSCDRRANESVKDVGVRNSHKGMRRRRFMLSPSSPRRERCEACPHRAHCEPEQWIMAMCDIYVPERAGVWISRYHHGRGMDYIREQPCQIPALGALIVDTSDSGDARVHGRPEQNSRRER